LVVLSILSCGLFELYWIYRNWRFVKEHEELDVSPFWRGVLGIFYFRPLLEHIKAHMSTTEEVDEVEEEVEAKAEPDETEKAIKEELEKKEESKVALPPSWKKDRHLSYIVNGSKT